MRLSLLASCALLCAPPAFAQSVADDPPLDEITVSGEFPGPGLWKVTRAGDEDGHVLWILGGPPPLPDGMRWKSKDVEAVVLSAQEILFDAGMSLQPDEKIGVFRGLTLVPAALKARRNPEGAKLESLMPADLHARWLVQKKLYLGRDSGMEKWRPFFAADKLQEAAVEKLKLRGGYAVGGVIGKLASDHKIKVNSPILKLTFKSDDLRSKIKEFSRESLSDLECFESTVLRVEKLSDRDSQNARARAWATGDLEALAQMPELPDPSVSCETAVLNALVAREVIPADIREQAMALWLAAAGEGLAANQITFALVPFENLTRAGGYLARLREKGYLIEEPK